MFPTPPAAPDLLMDGLDCRRRRLIFKYTGTKTLVRYIILLDNKCFIVFRLGMGKTNYFGGLKTNGLK
jgi:hypothetical protein